jgi:hypothetical protein
MDGNENNLKIKGEKMSQRAVIVHILGDTV